MLNLSGIDLNLLVAFDALVAEGSVTRAARRVGLSQPAMSHALNRLRGVLGDPLLVRSGARMVLTDRAHELAEPVRNALSTLQRALVPATFDPQATRRVFHIATADLIEVAFVPRLLTRLRTTAPLVDLRVYSLPRGLPVEELQRGQYDLAIGSFSDLPAGFVSGPLVRERFTCIVRDDHPRVDGAMDLALFAGLGHVLVAPGGRPGGLVDRVLADHGLTRRVVVTTPHFMVAPMLVVGSDLVCTLAERVAAAVTPHLPLRKVQPPVEMPSFGLNMVWHRRADEDPAQCWLREQFRAVTAAP